MAGMGALREKSHELPTMRRRLVPRKASARSRVSNGAGRVLDTQIEAQVHGPIDLHQDVELLVADPARHLASHMARRRARSLRSYRPSWL